MSTEKKAYPLRISADVLDAVQHWADDELRSVNAQIEFLLRDALAQRGIKPKRTPARAPSSSSSSSSPSTSPSSRGSRVD